MKLTGVVLDRDQAVWLADVGRRYEAEGRESELVYAIWCSAEASIDAWAYLAMNELGSPEVASAHRRP